MARVVCGNMTAAVSPVSASVPYKNMIAVML
jgi:hypothetical protein